MDDAAAEYRIAIIGVVIVVVLGLALIESHLDSQSRFMDVCRAAGELTVEQCYIASEYVK